MAGQGIAGMTDDRRGIVHLPGLDVPEPSLLYSSRLNASSIVTI